MMKKLGYKGEFAGAVEAAASTGGQLMPPIMGAAAFLMAESLGMPYITIVKAAIIPAILYFTGIVFLIHNNVSEISELDKIKLANLASAWYDYSIGIILGVKYPKTIYRYANKNEIYHSDKRLNSSELRKLKIYTNHIFGKEMISYE